ncbi:hypothetical protein TVAG_551770 [Trichomonas vaginalis G3]|uniref:Uncharacterized protein n=1 Tax=Trichomonas vaginalis (strain ATCC PRA-98 / G3) TaxID=412133 RepID=A2GCQ9_TRIV3|nr:hypothetical protein TVAGG3_0057540 [Trichomonas vaginalis G3]EAX85058.1 hypothetical protein TVAG_551770 [Trichomonas vaginalis G3]KAI5541753.1 hypothetical protein TVAGG3_0057540 [Trichomonas vaginalis G3]|eukprot:XP_001297988.1 hypothetical protein [Trichomonas vaginalis G3]
MAEYDFDDDFIDDEDEGNPFVLGDEDEQPHQANFEDENEDDFGTETPEPTKTPANDEHDFSSDGDEQKEDEKAEESQKAVDETPLPEEKVEEEEAVPESPHKEEPELESQPENQEIQENNEDSSKLSSSLSSKKDLSDDDVVKEVMETEEIFNRSQKISTLNQSLSLRLTETNQLFSLLMCVLTDTQLLMHRNRTSMDFSIYDEVELSGKPYKYDGGLIKHPKYVDGYNLSGCSDVDKTGVLEYLDYVKGMIDRGLPQVVEASVNIMQDPLVKAHRKLASMEQRINDLKRSNAELQLQTRHTANQLVKLEKQGESEFKATTGKSDVIIQQQRLQKALLRVSMLKDDNEKAQSENSKLLSELNSLTSRSSSRSETNTNSQLVKDFEAINASIEQSEEERETAMAQRRVSITRMNKTIEKLEGEISVLQQRLSSVDNKIRIMTQGKASRNSAAGSKLQKAAGSKIPVPSKKPKQ